MNMMREQFFGAILAIIVLLFSYRNQKLPQHLLPVFIAVSAPIHPLFTAIALVYFAACISLYFQHREYRLLLSLLQFVAIAILMQALYSIHFPTTFQPTYLSIIAGSVPGKTSMLWHYSDVLPTLSLDLLIQKFLVAVKTHLFQFPVYLYTNLALISALYITIIKKRRLKKIECLLVFILIQYVALSVLMQTQPRYQQIFSVVSFLTIALALHAIWDIVSAKVKGFVFLVAVFTNLTTSVHLGHTLNQQAIQESYSLSELQNQLNTISTDSRLVLVDSDHETKLSYLLRPRKVLSVKTEFISHEAYKTILSRFQPELIISTQPVDSFPYRHQKDSTLTTTYLGEFYTYKIHNTVVSQNTISRPNNINR